MKKIFLIAGVLSFIVVACSEERKDTVDNTEVVQLYSELCDAYRSYADSLECAQDTISRLRIADALSESLRNIYASHSPDLDRGLTEGQNDTLWMLTRRYMKLRNDRLGSFSAASDTSGADTTSMVRDYK